MIKIIYVLNRKDIFSGGEISVLELLARIDRSQFEPVAVCPGDGQMSKRIEAMGIKTVIMAMPTAKTLNVLRTRQTINCLRGIIREEKAHIVHANGSRAQFYSACAAKGTAASLVWHVREAKRDIGLYDRFLTRRADRVVCVSETACSDRFCGKYDRRKTSIIYNGVDIHSFVKDEAKRSEVRERYRVGNDDLLLGIVAIIEPRKGQDILLKAFSPLSGGCPGAKLIIVGKTVNDRYRKQLEKITEDSGLSDRVIFAGQQEDIVAIFSALDVFVLPSGSEGFSRALIEAMSCSLPVIATSVAGNVEAVKDRVTGLLVPHGDPDALREAIIELVSDMEAAREMGEKGRKRAEDFFSIERHVAHVQNLYCKMARG